MTHHHGATMHRRMFVGSLVFVTLFPIRGDAASVQPGMFEIVKPEHEWRRLLPPDAYYVLRRSGTERPFTSPLLNEGRDGVFHCRGCNLPLYSSATKYESGTGWPSFWEALEGSVATSVDRSLFTVRTEVHCRRCGGHLGHIFTDGPKPTGLRHCINGVALHFIPNPAIS